MCLFNHYFQWSWYLFNFYFSFRLFVSVTKFLLIHLFVKSIKKLDWCFLQIISLPWSLLFCIGFFLQFYKYCQTFLYSMMTLQTIHRPTSFGNKYFCKIDRTRIRKMKFKKKWGLIFEKILFIRLTNNFLV